MAGTTINLSGNSTTAQLAQDAGQGDTLDIAGALDNSGATLSIGTGGDFAGIILEWGASITGGVIRDTGAAVSFLNGTLNGVTYEGTLDLTKFGSSLHIAGGLIATGANGAGPGVISLDNYSNLYMDDTQTLDNATVTLGFDSGLEQYTTSAVYGYSNPAETLTLGANLTVETSSLAGIGSSSNGTVDNAGTINVTGYGLLIVNPTSFVNEGTINVATNATLDVTSASFANNGIIADNGGVAIRGTLSGAGVIDVGANSKLILDGAVQAGNSIFLTGQGASIEIDSVAGAAGNSPFAVGAKISGFANGDKIFVYNVQITRAIYTSTGETTGTLALLDRNNNTLETLDLVGGAYAGAIFTPTIVYGGLYTAIDVSALSSYITVSYFLAHQASLDALGAFTVTDIAANVAAEFDALSADANVTAIQLADGGVLTLTEAQAANDGRAIGILSSASPVQIAIVDTAANIARLTGTLRRTLFAEGINAASVLGAGGAITQTISWNAHGSTTTVQNFGITGQLYTSDEIFYGANGKPTSETFSNGMSETWTYNSDGAYQIAYAGVMGQAYTSYTIQYGSNGKPTSEVFSNGQAASWTYNSDGSYQIAYTGVTGQAYASNTIQYGPNGKPVSEVFSNGLAASWTYNSDGSYQIAYSGVTGQSYASYTIQYGSNGKPTSEVFSDGKAASWSYNSDGSYQIAYTGVTGQAYTSYTVQYALNGKPTSEVFGNGQAASWTYNSDGSYQIAYTGVTAQAYTSYTVQYGPNGKPTSEVFGNGQAASWTYNTDGSCQIAYTGVTGQAYTSYENIYTSANRLEAQAFDNANGSGRLSLYDSGLTVAAGSAFSLQLSASAGGDVFTLNPHANETIAATTTSTGDTFVFSRNFGHDALTGFVATGASHDTLQFAISDFAYLNAGMTQADDVAAVLANSTQTAAGNTVIADSFGDTLTLSAITKATLGANAADFAFK